MTFFLGIQRCDTIVFTHLVYVTKLFTARSELFRNCFCCYTALFRLFCFLSRRKRIWFWFECRHDSAKPSVEGHITYYTVIWAINQQNVTAMFCAFQRYIICHTFTFLLTCCKCQRNRPMDLILFIQIDVLTSNRFSNCSAISCNNSLKGKYGMNNVSTLNFLTFFKTLDW